MVDSTMPKSFLRTGQIKKYQLRGKNGSGNRHTNIDGIFLKDLI